MELYNSSKYMRYLIHLFHDWPLPAFCCDDPSVEEIRALARGLRLDAVRPANFEQASHHVKLTTERLRSLTKLAG